MTEKEAIKLYESKWWETKTDKEIAKFQLYEERLCCPFDIFHKAIETYLGRPVWTHEFADQKALIQEAEGNRTFEGPIQSLQRIAPNKPIIIVSED